MRRPASKSKGVKNPPTTARDQYVAISISQTHCLWLVVFLYFEIRRNCSCVARRKPNKGQYRGKHPFILKRSLPCHLFCIIFSLVPFQLRRSSFKDVVNISRRSRPYGLRNNRKYLTSNRIHYKMAYCISRMRHSAPTSLG